MKFGTVFAYIKAVNLKFKAMKYTLVYKENGSITEIEMDYQQHSEALKVAYGFGKEKRNRYEDKCIPIILVNWDTCETSFIGDDNKENKKLDSEYNSILIKRMFKASIKSN